MSEVHIFTGKIDGGGELDFWVPSFTQQVTASGNKTAAQWQATDPEMVADSTILTYKIDGKNRYLGCGFTHVLCWEELNGKTVRFRNGNYVYIGTQYGLCGFFFHYIQPDLTDITYRSVSWNPGSSDNTNNAYGQTAPSYTTFNNQNWTAQFYCDGRTSCTAMNSKVPSSGYSNYNFSFWVGAENPKDPYADIPEVIPEGGTGTHDWTSTDDIDYPANPGISAVNTGFISLWSPTEQQMLNLSSYMWNADAFTIDFWKKLWADPLDVIYGLSIIPVDFRATGRSLIGGTESVVVGLVNTGVKMDYLVEQWIELDCGSIDLDEVWGAYLDYDPFTKLEIYLPYCGVHPLRTDDFMSGKIGLKYKIDLLSGACVALIKATKPNSETEDLDSVIYQFMGNCAVQVPVTASQFADAVRSVVSLAASIGSMVATGVGGAAAAKGGLSTLGKARLAERSIGEGAAAVENVMGIKPAIERSGAIGAAGGLLGVQTPYLIITRPRQAHPEDQNLYTGYPAFMTKTLGDLEGWTIVKAIHLENIECTAEELAEIDSLLKEGVIF